MQESNQRSFQELVQQRRQQALAPQGEIPIRGLQRQNRTYSNFSSADHQHDYDGHFGGIARVGGGEQHQRGWWPQQQQHTHIQRQSSRGPNYVQGFRQSFDHQYQRQASGDGSLWATDDLIVRLNGVEQRPVSVSQYIRNSLGNLHNGNRNNGRTPDNENQRQTENIQQQQLQQQPQQQQYCNVRRSGGELYAPVGGLVGYSQEWNSNASSNLNYLSSNASSGLITYKEPDLWLMNSGQIIPPPPPPPPRTHPSIHQIGSSSTANCSSKFVDSIRKIGLELESVSLSRQDSKNSSNPSAATEQSQQEDRPTCIVCCEDLHQIAVGQCNHTLLCITCAVRMRTFYRNSQCPLCKADNPELVCTQWKQQVPPFTELRKNVQFEGIEGLPYIKLDSSESKKCRGMSLRDRLNRLGSRSCPSCKQFTEFGSFKDLSMHLMLQHNQYYCFVCQKAKRQFTTELELFDRETLHSHLDTHPKCEFCNGLRYFSAREQKAHYQEEHYQCHICERMGLSDMWLEDVDDLLSHMRANHFTCNQCGDTVGFGTLEELNSHREAMHNAASSHFNVGVDPGRNELRIQLRGGRDENIDQVRDNLVMLLNYFREMFGSGEHNGFVHSIEDVMQQFQTQVGVDEWDRLRSLIRPAPSGNPQAESAGQSMLSRTRTQWQGQGQGQTQGQGQVQSQGQSGEQNQGYRNNEN
eukprot:TRINITY_DN3572_c0_g2_i1.p1 TRINITY_DN3572_c0_g2~~TRINITY_DN3572_c0_g2_i1.p1  ORF type:complete len:694 (+),score=33.06 TRINITY_DN3572_c0_g2_i1:392-2473(+)